MSESRIYRGSSDDVSALSLLTVFPTATVAKASIAKLETQALTLYYRKRHSTIVYSEMKVDFKFLIEPSSISIANMS